MLSCLLCLTGSKDHGRQTEEQVQSETGTLQGTVELHNVVQLIRRAPGYGYSMGNMPEMRTRVSENENVVIYMKGKGLRLSSDSESTHETMNQKNATFIPHVLPILKGTTVDFVNEDKTYHDVFSLSPIKKFNIGRRPTGENVPVKFDKAGIAQIFCDIHADMSAFIVVLDNPFFTKPDSRGSFRIDNVPPGTYVVKAWHERLHAREQTVTITAGSTTTVHFILE